MKNSVFAIAMMMIIGTATMSANNGNKNHGNNNNGNKNNHGVVANVNHGNISAYGNTYNMGGAHNMRNRHEMMMIEKKCHEKDMQARHFNWTKNQIRLHGNRKHHQYVEEVVQGHRTGHLVCRICGNHVH